MIENDVNHAKNQDLDQFWKMFFHELVPMIHQIHPQ